MRSATATSYMQLGNIIFTNREKKFRMHTSSSLTFSRRNKMSFNNNKDLLVNFNLPILVLKLCQMFRNRCHDAKMKKGAVMLVSWWNVEIKSDVSLCHTFPFRQANLDTGLTSQRCRTLFSDIDTKQLRRERKNFHCCKVNLYLIWIPVNHLIACSRSYVQLPIHFATDTIDFSVDIKLSSVKLFRFSVLRFQPTISIDRLYFWLSIRL